MTDLEELLNLLAVQIDGGKAANTDLVINLDFKDRGEKATLILKNGALTNRVGYQAKSPDAAIAIDKIDFVNIVLGSSSLDELVKNGKATVKGDATALSRLVEVTGKGDKFFHIVEP